MQPLKFLCTGDLHLGRYPARVPVGRAELSVDRVWDDIVEHAIQQRVDALLLIGDIVDEANRFYEALGPLKRGVERLIAARITTFAVAGNHDHEVLPPLVDTLASDHFRVLGRGGIWESRDLSVEGKVPVRLVGWSFPTRHVTTSPLVGFPALGEGPPTLALLHADLDVAGSLYAPVARRELLAQPVDAWLLGHQHGRQDEVQGGQRILYPGSPQPLRPPETGARGPTLLTVDHTGHITTELVPLATIRYESLHVDVSAADALPDVHRIIGVTITDRLRSLGEDQPGLRHVAFRLQLEGRTSLQREIAAAAESIEKALDVPEGGIEAGVERVVVKTRPRRDLAAHARDAGPTGVLARLLIELENGTADGMPLAKDAERVAESLLQTRAYLPLRHEGVAAPSPEIVREMMLEQGLLLLDSLAAQTEAPR